MGEKDIRKIQERLAECRKNKDLSYYELEELTGISKSTLQRYETGKIDKMPIDRLETIALALGVEPAYLMGWEDEEHSDAPYSPEADKIAELLERPEYKILFDKTKDMSPEQIERIVKIIDLTLGK